MQTEVTAFQTEARKFRFRIPPPLFSWGNFCAKLPLSDIFKGGKKTLPGRKKIRVLAQRLKWVQTVPADLGFPRIGRINGLDSLQGFRRESTRIDLKWLLEEQLMSGREVGMREFAKIKKFLLYLHVYKR